LLIEEATTYFARGDISSCCYSLIEALPIARAVNLPGKEEKIAALYARCNQRDPGSSLVKKLGKMVTAKAS